MRLRVVQVTFNQRLLIFEVTVFVINSFRPFLRLPLVQVFDHAVIRQDAALTHCIVHFTNVIRERFLYEFP